jgi:hypothetical protein
MRCSFLSAICLSVVVAGVGLAKDAPPGKHALLVGCTAYPNLAAKYQLKGPTNDVVMTTALLKERFGFLDDQIVTLTHESADGMRPTRANIVREFDALVGRVGDGDTVYILLAGHGGREPDDESDDPEDVEEDGYDEVFHPEDITTWHTKGPAVKGIADDQIRIWLDALRNKGAFVFLMADTCHSGSMDRGPADDAGLVRHRSLEPEVTTSPQEIERIEQKLRARSRSDKGEQVEDDLSASDEGGPARGGLVALYAVPANATEAEHPPPDGSTDKDYGRLSYAVNQILRRAVRPITYRELAQQLRWWYEQWQWYPVGYIHHGADLDREVLGREVWQDRSSVIMSREPDDSLSLNVGSLHGITVNSVFAVYPPADETQGDDLIGYVEVADTTPVSATVEPCEYQGHKELPAETFPKKSRCELAYAAVDLKLAVDVAPFDPAERDRAALTEIRTVIDGLSQQKGALVELVKDGEQPDVYALAGDGGVFLRRPHDLTRRVSARGSEVVPSTGATAPPLFGPFPREAAWQDRLGRSLSTMARAINLRKLVTASEERRAGEPFAPKVELDIVVKKWNPQSQLFETVYNPSTLELFDRDKVSVEVSNVGNVPVDVTILYVESAYRIISYLPTLVDAVSGLYNNRLEPDGKPKKAQFTINDSTVGLEDVIVIGVVGDPTMPPQNFAFLQQEGLEQARAAEARTRGSGSSAFQSPLGQLVSTAMYGEGTRGGNTQSEMSNYAVRRISWLVKKGKPAEAAAGQAAE